MKSAGWPGDDLAAARMIVYTPINLQLGSGWHADVNISRLLVLWKLQQGDRVVIAWCVHACRVFRLCRKPADKQI